MLKHFDLWIKIQILFGRADVCTVTTKQNLHGIVNYTSHMGLCYFLSILLLFSACSNVFSSIEKTRYFPVDLTGGFGFIVSTEDHLEGHAPFLTFSRRPQGWRPTSQSVDEWIAMRLEDNPLLGIASLIYASVLRKGGQRSWISAYKLSYTLDRDFYSNTWQFLIHAATNSVNFPGISSEKEDVKFNAIQPTYMRFIKMHPKAFVTAVSVRWNMFFCSRKFSSSSLYYSWE